MASGKLFVATVVEPQSFLVREIGGDRVRVEVLIEAGRDPHAFEPTPRLLAGLSRSKAFFRTGMGFEDQMLPKIQALVSDKSADQIRFVDLREGIVLRYLELHGNDESGQATTTGHAHHSDCCSHDGLDPHIWFAPTLLKTQAETILKTLEELDPEGSELYRVNFDRLIAKIEETRKTLEKILQSHQEQTVFVFHPSYGYFCDEFGLKQRAIEFEGKTPKPHQLAKLIEEAKQDFKTTGRSPVIFVQPEFNRAPAEALAKEVGGHLHEHSCLQRDILQSMVQFANMLSDPK